MDVLRRFPVVVEVWGWDEAAVGTDTHDPEALAIELQHAVFAETGLHCSIGIGDNKLRAKTATAFAKPAGRYRLTAENWLEVMGDRSTEALWGVGPKTARKLAELGISTVRQLAAADVERMRSRFGPTMGPWFVMLGRGVGSTSITDEPWVRRGLSHQTTFPRDLTDRGEIEAELTRLAERVTADVVAHDRWIERVAIIVRFPSFYTPTRVSKLPEPTQDAVVVARAAIGLLDRLDLRRPVRLLGVRAELTRADRRPQTNRPRHGSTSSTAARRGAGSPVGERTSRSPGGLDSLEARGRGVAQPFGDGGDDQLEQRQRADVTVERRIRTCRQGERVLGRHRQRRERAVGAGDDGVAELLGERHRVEQPPLVTAQVDDDECRVRRARGRADDARRPRCRPPHRRCRATPRGRGGTASRRRVPPLRRARGRVAAGR